MGAALSGVWSTGLLQKAAKTGLKATTGAVGGIVGFSSAIADGDPSNILQNTIIGVGTGSAIGGATANLPGNVVTGD